MNDWKQWLTLVTCFVLLTMTGCGQARAHQGARDENTGVAAPVAVVPVATDSQADGDIGPGCAEAALAGSPAVQPSKVRRQVSGK